MCIPCAAPALPALAWILIIAVALIGGVGLAVLRGLPFVLMAAWRYLSGARLIKDLGKKEADLPPRRLARHVHATIRVAAPAAALLSLTHPMFLYGLTATAAGTGVAVATQAIRTRRDNKLAQLTGPVRVKAEIGAGR